VGLFHKIDDAFVITLSKGVFRQVEVYHREQRVYAKHGSGYIRLLGARCTSTPNVSWDELDDPNDLIDKTGGRFGAPQYTH